MAEQPASNITEEQRQQWLNEQFRKGAKHLAENGIVVSTVDDGMSRFFYPLWAVLKVTSNESKAYWVLCGDLPSDFMAASNAKNGREALRHFVMSWQLKSENIKRSNVSDDTQRHFASIIQNRAEQLYKFLEKDALWGEV